MGNEFNPAEVDINEDETQQNIEITYTYNSESETKEIRVLRHPQPIIEIVQQDLKEDYAYLNLENKTELASQYNSLWVINNKYYPTQSIDREFKYQDGQIEATLLIRHPKYKGCHESVSETFNQPQLPPDDGMSEKAKATYETILGENEDHINYYTSFQKELKSKIYNTKVLSSEEILYVADFLKQLSEIDANKFYQEAEAIVKSELPKLLFQITNASNYKLHGPEVVVYGLHLVSLINILSIAEHPIDLEQEYQEITNAFHKIKNHNIKIKYSLQEPIEQSFWLNEDNYAKADDFWKTLQPKTIKFNNLFFELKGVPQTKANSLQNEISLFAHDTLIPELEKVFDQYGSP